jgi:hypothetical protein
LTLAKKSKGKRGEKIEGMFEAQRRRGNFKEKFEVNCGDKKKEKNEEGKRGYLCLSMGYDYYNQIRTTL